MFLSTYSIENIKNEKNLYDILCILLEFGIDINAKDQNGNTALSISIKKNFLSVSKLFINMGTDINIKNVYGQTPFLIACMSGNNEIIRALWELKPGTEIKDYESNTCLSYLCLSDNNEMVKLLMDSGVSSNLHNISYLAIACQRKNYELAKILIKNGANINVRGSILSPLGELCQNNSPTEVIKFLLDSGADINADYQRNKDAKHHPNLFFFHTFTPTPIELAFGNRNYNIVKFLLETGVNKYIDSKAVIDRLTYIAGRDGRNDIVELLKHY